MQDLRHFLESSQSLLITLLIVAGVITLLFLPFKIKALAGHDILGNSGYILMYLWGIKLFGAELGLTMDGLDIKTPKKKMSQKFKNFGKNGFVDIFIIKILRAFKLKKLGLYANVGLKDASKTAIACTSLNIPIGIFTALVLCYKPSARINTVVYPDFFALTLQFALHLKLQITLFDIFINAVLAVIKNIKRKTIKQQS